MKLSIIIPVYNEKNTIEEIIKRVLAVNLENLEKEIIVVDDGSTDGTQEILQKLSSSLPIKVFFHQTNQGKGSAVRTALSYVTGEYVIIQDADLEYDPEDYQAMLKPVFKGKAEVVYGSRFTGERRDMFFWHYVGNRFLSLITNILYNTTLSDMETCYKLIRTDILKNLNLKARGFEFEPEVTAKILRQGIKIYEVPVSYAGRDFSEGKKIRWTAGFKALWTLIKYRFIK